MSRGVVKPRTFKRSRICFIGSNPVSCKNHFIEMIFNTKMKFLFIYLLYNVLLSNVYQPSYFDIQWHHFYFGIFYYVIYYFRPNLLPIHHSIHLLLYTQMYLTISF
eukprot:Pompholyxophrys_sp_v1_NODE_2_length_20472_cov_5.132586.p18 type:complete len:106 gc:universal NODE_2_length_20472_cov_5.132586:18116-17799(-)